VAWAFLAANGGQRGQSAHPTRASGSTPAGGSTNSTGPFEEAKNLPVPISVTKPGTIDWFTDSPGWNAGKFAALIVRFPLSRS
jgi:hypothetical protein